MRSDTLLSARLEEICLLLLCNFPGRLRRGCRRDHKGFEAPRPEILNISPRQVGSHVHFSAKKGSSESCRADVEEVTRNFLRDAKEQSQQLRAWLLVLARTFLLAGLSLLDVSCFCVTC